MFLRGRGIGASSLTYRPVIPAFVQYLLQGRQRRRPEIDEVEHRGRKGNPGVVAHLLDVHDEIVDNRAKTGGSLNGAAIGN